MTINEAASASAVFFAAGMETFASVAGRTSLARKYSHIVVEMHRSFALSDTSVDKAMHK